VPEPWLNHVPDAGKTIEKPTEHYIQWTGNPSDTMIGVLNDNGNNYFVLGNIKEIVEYKNDKSNPLIGSYIKSRVGKVVWE
jgi:hypothetical protein